MARPPAGTPSARDRIIDVAGQLFYEKGIHQVGINEVIERSGVARMTLYHHFASKEALVEAMLEARSLYRLCELEAAMEGIADPQRKLLAAFDVLGAHVNAPGYRGCTFINAAIDIAAAENPAHSLVAEYKQSLAATFESIAIDAGWKRPKQLALQCLLLWDGAAVEAYLQGCDAPVRAAREAVIALVEAAAR